MANFKIVESIREELIFTKQKLQEQTEKNVALTEKLIENERITQNLIVYLLNETKHGENLKKELTQTKSELTQVKFILQKIKENLDTLI
jgi:hypothetical protein